MSDIGHAVQTHVEAHGFSVVREFVGHGIGAVAARGAADPELRAGPGRGPRLAEGMVLAIEPMVNMGKPAVRVLQDGWTAVTRDGLLSAHFEHTVAVTADGPLVLTAPGGAIVAGRTGTGRQARPFAGAGDRDVAGDPRRVSARRGLGAAAERALPGDARQRPPGDGAHRRDAIAANFVRDPRRRSGAGAQLVAARI